MITASVKSKYKKFKKQFKKVLEISLIYTEILVRWRSQLFEKRDFIENQ
jgi:hypothetical protein